MIDAEMPKRVLKLGNSYYNKSKGFNIDYKSLGEVVGEVFGDISDCEEDDMYMDTSIEE